MKPEPIYFFVRPLEWLAFGPPRSLFAGDGASRPSHFPPAPTAFQGLVRTHLLRAVARLDLNLRTEENKVRIAALVGDPDQLREGWQLAGPFPVVHSEGYAQPWLPAPRFLLARTGLARTPAAVHPIVSPHGGMNDLTNTDGEEPLLLGCPRDAAAKEALGGWLGPKNLLHALTVAGPTATQEPWDPTQHRRREPPFVRSEHRPGLALDPATGHAKDGMLYFQRAHRFGGVAQEAGLCGWLRGALPVEIPAQALTRGLASAGRNGRPVEFCVLPTLHPAWERAMKGAHLPKQVAEDDGFFVLALTPVQLQERSQLWARVTKIAELRGVAVHVRAALTGAPQTIGGLKMATRQSRSNLAYSPAGSAWLIQLHGGNAEGRREILGTLHNNHLLGPKEEATFGYGHTLVALGPKLSAQPGRTP